jgi:hypothetical protein
VVFYVPEGDSAKGSFRCLFCYGKLAAFAVQLDEVEGAIGLEELFQAVHGDLYLLVEGDQVFGEGRRC